MNEQSTKQQHCGYVAIIGRPNVGKSTLLNSILGMKLSITSRKPQTTRHQILGVKTTENIQTIYVDTPGIHQRRGTAINKYMNRAATSVLKDVDVLVGKMLGPNIKRLKNKFVAVIIREPEIEKAERTDRRGHRVD